MKLCVGTNASFKSGLQKCVRGNEVQNLVCSIFEEARVKISFHRLKIDKLKKLTKILVVGGLKNAPGFCATNGSISKQNIKYVLANKIIQRKTKSAEHQQTSEQQFQ